ncbi:UNVERIFIED_CONTAM: putative N-acetyltransferase YhbS [Brevibacillus sp. OAP136]
MKVVAWDRAYLGALCQFWNQELGERFPMREELFAQNSFEDANVLADGSWIALDAHTDRVIGFVVAKSWQEQGLSVRLGKGIGWIQVLLVAQNERGKGIGRELLARAERALIAHGAQKIWLGRDPYHYFPGVPEESHEVKSWFEHQGYTLTEPLENDLLCRYEEGQPFTVPTFVDVRFRLAERADEEALLRFLHRCFPGRWEYEAIHYFRRGGVGREFVVLEKEGEIIGFCRINDAHSPFIAQNVYWADLMGESYGGIGPLGVDPVHRQKGYGLAVVQAGIAFLRERGVTSIVIDWTTLVSFYEKLGYRSWKQYAKYSKDVN